MHKDVKEFILKRIKQSAGILIDCAYTTLHNDNFRRHEKGYPEIKYKKEEVILEFLNFQGDRAENILGKIVCNAILMQSDIDIIGEILKYWDDAQFPVSKI